MYFTYAMSGRPRYNKKYFARTALRSSLRALMFCIIHGPARLLSYIRQYTLLTPCRAPLSSVGKGLSTTSYIVMNNIRPLSVAEHVHSS